VIIPPKTAVPSDRRLADGPGADEAPSPGRPGLRQLALDLRLLHVGLEGARVDLVEQGALPDLGALLERHLVEVALHPGAGLARLDRVDPAGVVVVVGDLAADRLADGDLRGRGSFLHAAARRQPPATAAHATRKMKPRHECRVMTRGPRVSAGGLTK
jgi:hypothetical protein